MGFGIIIGIVSVTIAATSGVSDRDQGLASGLLTTSHEIGAAIGLAILVAVATARTQAISASCGHSLIATVGGFQAALGVSAGFAALGILVTVLAIADAAVCVAEERSMRSGEVSAPFRKATPTPEELLVGGSPTNCTKQHDKTDSKLFDNKR